MTFIGLTLAIAIVIGVALGGRPSGLARLRLRWPWLALLGFGLQLVNPPGRWPLAMLAASFVLLGVFAVANRGIPGFRVIAVGIAMNATVIAVNAGMPVSATALAASGQAATAAELADRADAYVKHHLAGPDDALLVLADVIPLPPPVAQAISLGDLVTYGGVVLVVVLAMRRPSDDAGATPALIAEGMARGDG